MIVTFVSECEKKSLPKTRRVLDAFANRIGSRTWQTVITSEGLQAVKQLLRSTASKNTAVSCHWLRSRSRSELIWVVGNKDKFNSHGIVPVNYTSQENILTINGIEVNIQQYYANTKKQPLDQHLFAVGYVASELLNNLVHDELLTKEAFIAGCWHDIGKSDPEFQGWLKKFLNKHQGNEVPDEGQHPVGPKFSWEKYPRHNEISATLYYLLADDSDMDAERIEHAIFWHHAKPNRKKDIERLIWVYDKVKSHYSLIVPSVTALMESINLISENYSGSNQFTLGKIKSSKFSDIEGKLEQKHSPIWKSYTLRDRATDYTNQINNNAKNNLIRTAVITADRLVSALDSSILNTHLENHTLDEIVSKALLKERGLKQNIQACLDWFEKNHPDSERNKQQTTAAIKLADEEVKVGVLRGPAGCGKTKIALEWALRTNAKKLFWICPRVQVCQGLFHDLQQANYLPEAKVEICTGEIKKITQSGIMIETETPKNKVFSGDVVITTIDQIINSVTTHRNVETLVAYLDAHVVFDEFHEYINMPGFNLLFAELVECKKLQQTNSTLPNALLISATPNPYFIEQFLKIPKYDIEGIQSFNMSNYQLKFIPYDDKKEDDSNPFYKSQPEAKNMFVITNTAITAQKSFIDNQDKENSILLHSKYKKGDREELFGKVVECFKQDGNKNYDLLRSGPVVQAALNITCDHMISEMIHAENTLQRLGRLDRFGKNSEVNIYEIAITDHVIAGRRRGNAQFLAKTLFCLQSTKTWYEFLQNKDVEHQSMTIDEIYQLYDEFYTIERHIEKIEQDFIEAVKKGVEKLYVFLTPPLEYKQKAKINEQVKIKKNSLRGNNRFVQMAKCEILNRDSPTVLNDYAFVCEGEKNDAMTWDIGRLEGVFYGQKDSDRSLLAFMAQKHHQILTCKTGLAIKKKNDSEYKKEALSPETPIYVSYTTEDLKLLGPSTRAKDDAIYYAIGNKQPIGAISLNDLKQKGE